MDKISATTQSILLITAEAATTESPIPRTSYSYSRLALPSPDVEYLRRCLLSRLLAEPLCTALCEAFLQNATSLGDRAIVRHAEASAQLNRVGCALLEGEADLAAQLDSAFNVNYQKAMEKLHNGFLGIVDKRRADFFADAATAVITEGGNADDDKQGGSRAHTTEAIAILERAFAHTNSITQAEKQRLAEATGLQPRQVTIWVSVQLSMLSRAVSAWWSKELHHRPYLLSQFQNRRNRKSKGRQIPKSLSESKKRKPESLNDRTEPCLPTTGKKRRTSVSMRTCSGSSSSSLSSSTSSVDSYDWSSGRTPKLRNSSTGTSSAASSLGGPATTFSSSPLGNIDWDRMVEKHGVDKITAEQALALSQHAMDGDGIFRQHEDMPQLDFEDLCLDPATLETDLRFDLSIKPLPPVAPSLADEDMITPRAGAFDSKARSSSNESMSVAEQQLSNEDLDVLRVIMDIAKAEDWSYTDVLDFSAQDETAGLEQVFLDLPSPNSMSASSASGSSSGQSSEAGSPEAFCEQDFAFDFSLSGLGLDTAFSDMRDKEAAAAVKYEEEDSLFQMDSDDVPPSVCVTDGRCATWELFGGSERGSYAAGCSTS